MKSTLQVFSGLLMAAILLAGCAKEPLSEFAALKTSDKAISTSDKASEIDAAKSPCATIPGGTIVDSDGDPITPGYNQWGYNYQAQIFNGTYCDAYKNAAWCQPYAEVSLIMKWNDAWISTKDCNGDGLLDRHFGYPGYIGSGAWLTNHQSGSYLDAEGNECNWTYFIKIVAVPSDATKTGGIWYNAEGTEIGPVIWGEFAIIQEVSNDPCAGQHGIQVLSPDHAGLGNW